MQKPKICHVSPKLYHLLTNNKGEKSIGGAELQGLLITTELLLRGYDISTITLECDPGEISENISLKLLPALARRGGGFPLVRFIQNILRISRVLGRSNADIYFLNVAGHLLAPIVRTARKHHSKVIFWAASDSNFDTRYKNFRLPNLRDKILYVWGLKRCNAYVVQNSAQRDLLFQRFGKKAQVIYNGIPKSAQVSRFEGEILWVGSVRKVKNPWSFLELARRVPSGRFVMVGGKAHPKDTLYDSIFEEARSIANIDFKGLLSFQEVESLFERVSLFVNTSEVEGFPNTFLQAWSRGVPVFSFPNVNPDDLISKHRLGLIVRNLDEMVEKVSAYLDHKISFSPQAIRSFFETHLTIEKTVDKFENLLQSLAQKDQ